MKDKITEEEFAQYIDVQDSGMFNMFSPQAREMTTLSKDQWIYILRNYDELREKYE